MVIKSTRLRWADHVAWMEEDRSNFKIATDKPTVKRPLGRLRLIRPRIGLIGEPCESGIEPPDFLSHGVHLKPSNYIIEKKWILLKSWH